MISASTPIRITRPIAPVILKSVSILSAFGEPPLSGVNVSARAGTAATSSTRAVAAITSRKIERFERKAGATIRGTWRGPRLGAREGRVAFFDERQHALAHVISAKKLMLDVGFQLQLRVQVAIDHPVDRALRTGVRARRPPRQPLGQVERLLRQRLGLHDLVDQAP